MSTRNVTLSLPIDLLKQIKVIAAKQDTSISAMLTQSLRKIAQEQDETYEEAHQAMMADIRKGFVFGPRGKSLTRDELHERNA